MKKVFIAAAATTILMSCTSTPEVLKDLSFNLTELNGTEYIYEGNYPAVIIFQDGRMNADLGGNSISALYKEGKDGALKLEQGASTKMLVPEEFREDEFIAAMNSIAKFAIADDTICLMDKDGNILMKAVKEGILNGAYDLTELNGTEYVQFGEMPAGFSFIDGRISANLGGNSIFANIEASEDGSVKIEQGGATRMFVPEELREDEFIAAMNSIVKFTKSGDTLSFFDAEGNEIIKGVRR